jgi:hypothetical protein
MPGFPLPFLAWPEYNLDMNGRRRRRAESDDLIVVLSVPGAICWIALAESIAAGNSSLFMALVAAPIGAAAVFLIVRTLNRRDDPQEAMPPPDAHLSIADSESTLIESHRPSG